MTLSKVVSVNCEFKAININNTSKSSNIFLSLFCHSQNFLKNVQHFSDTVKNLVKNFWHFSDTYKIFSKISNTFLTLWKSCQKCLTLFWHCQNLVKNFLHFFHTVKILSKISYTFLTLSKILSKISDTFLTLSKSNQKCRTLFSHCKNLVTNV